MKTREKCFLAILCVFGILGSTNAQTIVRVTAVLDVPYLMLDLDGQFSGIVPDILDSLKLNYTISLTNYYGTKNSNGSWTGMVGELVNGDADITTLLTVTAMRAEVIDFSYPVMPVGHSILMKKPQDNRQSVSENLAQLFYPFELSVWLMILIALFVTGTVLYIMMHFNPYEWRRMSRDHEATVREGESFTCLNSFFFVISTLLWQGYVRAPRSIGARVLVTAWWLFTVIFIVSYTASLTNFLRSRSGYLFSQQFFKIHNLEDLATNDDVRVGFLRSGATSRFFSESKSPVYQKLYQRAIKDPDFDELLSIANIVKKVRTNKETAYAAIIESPTARYISNRLPCDLYAVNADGFMYRNFAFGLQKNSTLARYINLALMKLSETGQLEEIEDKWYDGQAECSDNSRPARQDPDDFYSLKLSTFSSAMLIIVAGIVIGGIICIIEICIFKWAESRDSSDEADVIKADEEPLKAAEGKGAATPV